MVDSSDQNHDASSTADAAPPSRNLRRRRNTSVSSSVAADTDSARIQDDEGEQTQRRATRKRKTGLTSALAVGVKRAGAAIKSSSSSSRNDQSAASSSGSNSASAANNEGSTSRRSNRSQRKGGMRDQLKALASGRGARRSVRWETEADQDDDQEDAMDLDVSSGSNEADEVANMLGVEPTVDVPGLSSAARRRRSTAQQPVEPASSSNIASSSSSAYVPPRTPSPSSDPLYAERMAARARLAEALNAPPLPRPHSNVQRAQAPPQQRPPPAAFPPPPPPPPLHDPAHGLPPQPSPRMLSLLRDVLGLRGRANGPPGAAGPGLPVPGTTVIVQGALVSRTLPSPSAAAATGAGNNSAPASASAASGDAPMPDAPGDNANAPENMEGAEPGQAATLEDQAEMLSRLLSIAAAATAASLVAGPDAQRAADSFNSDATNALRRRGPSAGTRSASSAAAPGAQAASSSQSSTIGALRDRLSALTDRLRAPRVAANPPAAQPAPVPAAAAAEEAAPAAGDASGNTTGPLSSLGQMLRDALTGFGNTGAAPPAPPRPQAPVAAAVPSSSSASTSGSTEEARALRSTNATLERVREGNVVPGEDGSFDRFIFNLGHDLSAAVRSLTTFLPPESVAAAEAARGTAQTVDAETQARRQSDVQGGQLAFFRLFSFEPILRPAPSESNEPLLARRPSARRASESDVAASGAPVGARLRPRAMDAQQQPPQAPQHTHLVPCVMIGVRSLSPTDAGGAIFGDEAAPAAAAAEGAAQAEAVPADAAAENAPPAAGAPAADAGGNAEGDAAGGAGAAAVNDRNVARYLLFVSGGQYEPDHPMLTAPSGEAAQDLMQLMEFLSRMAQYKPQPISVTQAEIDGAGLERLTGKASDVAARVAAGDVMANTAERCLICLEDWLADEEQDCRLLACKHIYHTACIDRWLKARNACPLCRAEAVKKAPPGAAPAPAQAPEAAGAGAAQPQGAVPLI